MVWRCGRSVRQKRLSSRLFKGAHKLVMDMLGSVWDWLVLIVVALVVFGGSKKISEIARGLGRAAGEFKRGQLEVEREIREVRAEGRTETRGAGAAQTSPAGSGEAARMPAEKPSIEERIAALERELEELKKMRDKPS